MLRRRLCGSCPTFSFRARLFLLFRSSRRVRLSFCACRPSGLLRAGEARASRAQERKKQNERISDLMPAAVTAPHPHVFRTKLVKVINEIEDSFGRFMLILYGTPTTPGRSRLLGRQVITSHLCGCCRWCISRTTSAGDSNAIFFSHFPSCWKRASILVRISN